MIPSVEQLYQEIQNLKHNEAYWYKCYMDEVDSNTANLQRGTGLANEAKAKIKSLTDKLKDMTAKYSRAVRSNPDKAEIVELRKSVEYYKNKFYQCYNYLCCQAEKRAWAAKNEAENASIDWHDIELGDYPWRK